MTRLDYLKKAALLRTTKIPGVELAKEMHSTTAIDQAVAGLLHDLNKAKSRYSFWYWTGFLALFAMIGGVVTLLVSAFSRENGLQGTLLAVGGMVGLMLAAHCRASAYDEKTACNKSLALLRPITGTSICIDAAELVRQGLPDVLAWRDLAVADRGQLHTFDVEVMRALSEVAERTREAEARAQVIQSACHQAHGLTSIATSNVYS